MALNYGLLGKSDDAKLERNRLLSYSINPGEWQTYRPNVNPIILGGGETKATNGFTDSLIVGFHLPDNAVIVSGIIDGNNTALTWYLKRCPLGSNVVEIIASAPIGSTSITPVKTKKTVDNSKYSYFLEVSLINDATDRINTGRIIYTMPSWFADEKLEI